MSFIVEQALTFFSLPRCKRSIDRCTAHYCPQYHSAHQVQRFVYKLQHFTSLNGFVLMSICSIWRPEWRFICYKLRNCVCDFHHVRVVPAVPPHSEIHAACLAPCCYQSISSYRYPLVKPLWYIYLRSTYTHTVRIITGIAYVSTPAAHSTNLIRCSNSPSVRQPLLGFPFRLLQISAALCKIAVSNRMHSKKIGRYRPTIKCDNE